jgi:hypothetical protein
MGVVIPLCAGFTEKEFDDVKGIFLDTNLPLLLLTVFISLFHLLFDFLAFKNEISFWRGRRSTVGLSTRTSEHVSPFLLPSCSRLSCFRSKPFVSPFSSSCVAMFQPVGGVPVSDGREDQSPGHHTSWNCCPHRGTYNQWEDPAGKIVTVGNVLIIKSFSVKIETPKWSVSEDLYINL